MCEPLKSENNRVIQQLIDLLIGDDPDTEDELQRIIENTKGSISVAQSTKRELCNYLPGWSKRSNDFFPVKAVAI